MPKPVTLDRESGQWFKSNPRATWYGGVDPGLSGGVAFVSSQGECDTVPMPATRLDNWELYKGASRRYIIGTIAVEWIHPSIQGISKKTQSILYGSYERQLSLLMAIKLNHYEVKPVEWMRGLGLRNKKKGESRTKWKDYLRGVAQGLYPRAPVWDLPVTHQRLVSDAILIAHWCKLANLKGQQLW